MDIADIVGFTNITELIISSTKEIEMGAYECFACKSKEIVIQRTELGILLKCAKCSFQVEGGSLEYAVKLWNSAHEQISPLRMAMADPNIYGNDDDDDFYDCLADACPDCDFGDQ